MSIPADQLADVLHVAREHGTRVAAEWFGHSRTVILRARKHHDGYTRGRGHPTRDELAREPVRDTCNCVRCRAARGINIPRLTPDQQKLVEANTRLVGFFVTKWGIPSWQADDAYQDGLLGLMRAAQLYDPTRGFTFSTFAQHQIRAAIQRGRARYEGINFRAEYRHSAPPLHAPWYGQPVSLDLPIDDNDPTLTLGTAIADRDTDTEADAVQALQYEELGRALRQVCRDDLDRDAVACLAGTDTYKAVAARHKVSDQAVRLRAERIKTRLRHPTLARTILEVAA